MKQAQGRNAESKQRAWVEGHSDKVAMLGVAEIFDGAGKDGIWDQMNMHFGAKTIPSRSTST